MLTVGLGLVLGVLHFEETAGFVPRPFRHLVSPPSFSGTTSVEREESGGSPRPCNWNFHLGSAQSASHLSCLHALEPEKNSASLSPSPSTPTEDGAGGLKILSTFNVDVAGLESEQEGNKETEVGEMASVKFDKRKRISYWDPESRREKMAGYGWDRPAPSREVRRLEIPNFAREANGERKHSMIMEAGGVATHADGAVLVDVGGTTVLCTCVLVPLSGPGGMPGSSSPPPGGQLKVEYSERKYAGGKIPGSFTRREMSPGDAETLISRVIDRPLRPLIPESFPFEIEVSALLVSFNPEIDPAVVAINGCAVAVQMAGVPLSCRGLVAGRVGIVPGREAAARGDGGANSASPPFLLNPFTLPVGRRGLFRKRKRGLGIAPRVLSGASEDRSKDNLSPGGEAEEGGGDGEETGASGGPPSSSSDSSAVVGLMQEELLCGGLDLLLVLSPTGLTMAEGTAKEIPEKTLEDAMKFAKETTGPWLKKLYDFGQELQRTYRRYPLSASPSSSSSPSASSASSESTDDRDDSSLPSSPEMLIQKAAEPDTSPREAETLVRSAARLLARRLVPQLLPLKLKRQRISKRSLLERELLQSLLDLVSAAQLSQNGNSVSTVSGGMKPAFQLRCLSGIASDELSREFRLFLRYKILSDGIRMGDRGLEEVRPIECATAVLDRPHGSALFTRGGTQSLCTVTLGGTDELKEIDELRAMQLPFVLDYNFPGFAVNEKGKGWRPNRRAIGHGWLAGKALGAVVPAPESFPFMTRVVSEITESDGSSSMATVCAASLALHDAGVPLLRPLAGVAMGLVVKGEEDDAYVKELERRGDRGGTQLRDFAVLTDITGTEDALGDLDFKVAGSSEGVTALQMDTKLSTVPFEMISQALAQARRGREHVLRVMAKELDRPRMRGSPSAPSLVALEVPPVAERAIIYYRRRMEETFDVNVDVGRETARVTVTGFEESRVMKGVRALQRIVREHQPDALMNGTIVSVSRDRAFVEMPSGISTGVVHVSALQRLTGLVSCTFDEFFRPGDEVEVRVQHPDEVWSSFLMDTSSENQSSGVGGADSLKPSSSSSGSPSSSSLSGSTETSTRSHSQAEWGGFDSEREGRGAGGRYVLNLDLTSQNINMMAERTRQSLAEEGVDISDPSEESQPPVEPFGSRPLKSMDNLLGSEGGEGEGEVQSESDKGEEGETGERGVQEVSTLVTTEESSPESLPSSLVQRPRERMIFERRAPRRKEIPDPGYAEGCRVWDRFRVQGRRGRILIGRLETSGRSCVMSESDLVDLMPVESIEKLGVSPSMLQMPLWCSREGLRLFPYRLDPRFLRNLPVFVTTKSPLEDVGRFRQTQTEADAWLQTVGLSFDPVEGSSRFPELHRSLTSDLWDRDRKSEQELQRSTADGAPSEWEAPSPGSYAWGVVRAYDAMKRQIVLEALPAGGQELQTSVVRSPKGWGGPQIRISLPGDVVVYEGGKPVGERGAETGGDNGPAARRSTKERRAAALETVGPSLLQMSRVVQVYIKGQTETDSESSEEPSSSSSALSFSGALQLVQEARCEAVGEGTGLQAVVVGVPDRDRDGQARGPVLLWTANSLNNALLPADAVKELESRRRARVKVGDVVRVSVLSVPVDLDTAASVSSSGDVFTEKSQTTTEGPEADPLTPHAQPKTRKVWRKQFKQPERVAHVPAQPFFSPDVPCDFYYGIPCPALPIPVTNAEGFRLILHFGLMDQREIFTQQCSSDPGRGVFSPLTVSDHFTYKAMEKAEERRKAIKARENREEDEENQTAVTEDKLFLRIPLVHEYAATALNNLNEKAETPVNEEEEPPEDPPQPLRGRFIEDTVAGWISNP
uniref:polyribonucleotide nucleotidyltransferase n=1 Tax=Chromera velia CCMP2878 TaxID=1169474 RepID=A0A0G4FMI0_9ALVE|eukprot:Cvel_3519.t1-p1 / transcript=Cvel_3519.t1 / gene=Cvel_3519 / organism=Chromera_velia_CCMP2878 / gene_product=Polyribonucleotide nucleotidyltransferase, putative / transcript_product=Polyribonucleotide nucleotidyltransferase, putative / location=Cvel_scaffold143:17679-35175(+) / protein_length=1835 / sequence_SO=supercontig / SO=protein_coding / is_pseudo=false